MPVTISQLYNAKLLDSAGQLSSCSDSKVSESILLKKLLSVLTSRQRFECFLDSGRPVLYAELVLYNFCAQHKATLLSLFN